jgi:hypothetical protein
MVGIQRDEPVLVLCSHRVSVSQGSIVSSIGYGINAIISAIAGVLETIIGAIVAVRIVVNKSSASHPNLISQVIVAIFDVILDILCCRCCGSRRTGMRTGRRSYYRRRGFGRGRGVRTTAGAY